MNYMIQYGILPRHKMQKRHARVPLKNADQNINHRGKQIFHLYSLH